MLVKPYKNITLQFISSELGIDIDEVEHLIISCILDRLIDGRLDQINQVLIMNSKGRENDEKYAALARWAEQIEKLSFRLTS